MSVILIVVRDSVHSEEADVGGGRSGVKDTGPEEATGEVDHGFNVLLVSLHVGRDGPFVSGHAPLVGLAVDSEESLVSGIPV